MKRIKDEFLPSLEKYLNFTDSIILEIGCGNGSRLSSITPRIKRLIGIDPDRREIEKATAKNLPNSKFSIGSAEQIPLPNESVEISIFTLSLHHVPIPKMAQSIDEAIRVTQKDGYIVFLEPSEIGSFFEAELLFDACDGDERKEKKFAQEAIHNHNRLIITKELDDETIFQFDSREDFDQSMEPKKNFEKIDTFLNQYEYRLNAHRHITICRPVHIIEY